MTAMQVTRVMALVLISLSSTTAAAGEVKFVVPVNLRGLPAESNLATINCYLIGDDEAYGIGGGTTAAITGGALLTTLSMLVRKSDTLAIRSRSAPEYYCRIIVSGERPDTNASAAIDNSLVFQLMPSENVRATGWTGTALGWPGYPRSATVPVTLRSAPGAPASLIVRGTVSPAAVALLEISGSCPCGCGATTGAGSACNTTRTPTLPRVYTPATPEPLPKGPAFDPYNRKATTPVDKSSLPVTVVSTPQIYFSGTGTLELASASR